MPGTQAVVAGAFWSLPFQLIITPARWGREAATDVVDIEMECQVHHEDDLSPAACYPVFLLTEMEGGSSLYSPNVPRPEAEDKED
jgi:hypothetical protein